MKRTIINILIILICITTANLSIYAEDSSISDITINEDDLFSDENVVVQQETVTDDNIAQVTNQESVSFTGDISASFGYSMDQDFLDGNAAWKDNPYNTLISANLLLDIRLKQGIKAFANLGVGYIPGGQPVIHSFTDVVPYPDYSNISDIPLSTLLAMLSSPDKYYSEKTDTIIGLKEVFVDANIGWLVYTRIGKQVLKWGRGFFWNPTDLINIEKKSFFDTDALRQGTYGFKLHVPAGTFFNFYSFLNFTNVETLDQVALAAKTEFLLGNTEFSFSGLFKIDQTPVWGVDFASHLWIFDLWGEAGFIYEDTNYEFVETLGTWAKSTTEEMNWVPRACIGASTSFDFMDVTDRIRISSEFYYNHGGFDTDQFGKYVNTVGGSAVDLFTSLYFQPNNYGKYYAALFTSFAQFISKEASLSLSAIANLSDISCIVNGGINFASVDNFSLGVNLIGYLGEADKEYTLSGNRISGNVSMSLRF